MLNLHLNSNWLVALFGIGSICFGFASVNRRTITLIDGLKARDRDLGQELAERKQVPDYGGGHWGGGTGAAALEQLKSTTAINLLLTDVVRPGGMKGRELATEAGRCTPGVKVLYMSGYSENAITHHGRLDADAVLLRKPFRRADLARAVRRALDSP